jgi:PAS domain S-box-containing protein
MSLFNSFVRPRPYAEWMNGGRDMTNQLTAGMDDIIIPPEIAANAEHFFEKIAAVAPSILYVFDLEKMENIWANRSLFDHLGYTDHEVQAMGSSILQALMHPEDFARYPAHFTHLISLDSSQTSKFEYRMRHKAGHWVWLHSHEAPYAWSDDGNVSQIIGSAHDISDIKNAAAEVELISSELKHRVSNIFAVVSALVSMTGRRNPDAGHVFEGLTARLGALATAHQLAFQMSKDTDVDARTLLEQALAPYLQLSTVSIAADGVSVPAGAVSPIALIVHELATNAVKYGALRSAEGRLDIALNQTGDEVVMRWRETCVPPIETAKPTEVGDGAEGFGSRMIDLSVRQIHGSLLRELGPDGISVTLTLPASSER